MAYINVESPASDLSKTSAILDMGGSQKKIVENSMLGIKLV
jgi:hypothetical protein